MATKMNQKMTQVKKFTTLEDLEKSERGPVYVLNNTKGDLEGRLVISIPKKNGNGSDILRIPRSFIPVDVTKFISRSQLLEAAEFRSTVGKRLIKLLTPEYASLILNTEEGREEQKRLLNEANRAQAILKKAGVVEEQLEDDEDEYVEVDNTKKTSKKVKEEVKGKAGGPSLKVQNVVANATREESTQVQIVAKLKNLTKITKHDLAYLAAQYKDRPKIMSFLRETLAELKATTA